MNIGERLRVLREQRRLSQGEVETLTGLNRVYISRIENGHTAPSPGTLEKLATKGFGLKLYQFLYDGENPPKSLSVRESELWGNSGKEARYLEKLIRLLSKMNETDQTLLLNTLAKMVASKK